MQKRKQLIKIISKLVDVSLVDGKLIEAQVIKSIKILKSFSKSQAIFALSEYLKQLRRKERQHILYIETFMPLSTAQINKVKKIVEKKIKITKIVSKINPEILGGFKLKIGDEIWDESLANKIDQVKEAVRG